MFAFVSSSHKNISIVPYFFTVLATVYEIISITQEILVHYVVDDGYVER